VDRELVDRPRRWNIRFIGRFMIEFGVLSSVFDFLTFWVLLAVFSVTPTLFRTAWFIESLLTELAIALVVRTRRPFLSSRPGTLFLILTVGMLALTVAIPFMPYSGLLGFEPLPPILLATLGAIAALYVAAAELTKRWFYRRVSG
jgi:Mg2+-importing ATPase